MSPSFFSMRSILLLGALWSSVSVEAAHSLGKRDALSPRQTCRNPSWISVCPGLFSCIPPGGICCSDGFSYAMPPATCPDGTEPVATAIVSDTVSTTTEIDITTTAPVTTLPSEVDYIWYTWTITYYYYYYYYTYFELSAELTSTRTTSYTTVSLTATDEVEASSLYLSLSSSLSHFTPTQTSTPTSGSEPVAPSTTAISAYPTAPTGNNTLPTSSTPPVPFTGAAASLRAGTASYFGNVFVFATGALMVVPGLLMLWL